MPPLLRTLLTLCVTCALVSAQSTDDPSSSSSFVLTSDPTSGSSSSTSPTSGTSTSPSPTSGGDCDATCTLGNVCNNLCEQSKLQLPQKPSLKPLYSQLQAQPNSHFEVNLDARVLQVGETLALRPQFGAAVLLTCRSNMAGDQYLHQAGDWLAVTLIYSDNSGERCPELTLQLPREINLRSVAGSGGREAGVIEFPEDQDPPAEGGEWEWSVPVTSHLGGGYGVNVSVELVQLNAERGDLLTINPGLQRDLARAAVFSWRTQKSDKREVRILGQDSFFVYLKLGQSPLNANAKFRLSYNTTDEVTEAPTVPSTTPALPTAPANVSDSIDVYIGGVTPEEFISRIDEFKSSMAMEADNFCAETGIELAEPIGPNNVVVFLVERCPNAWPDYERCVAVQFSIPVFTEPDNVTGVAPYELTGSHLEQIWSAITDKTLPEPMHRYSSPGSVFWWWIGLTFAVLVLVILLVVIAWRVDVYHSVSRYNKTSLITSGSSGRGSGSWGDVGTLPHQVVPPYLVVDAEQTNKKLPEIYSQDWGYSERSSYSVTGMDNEGFDEDEEIDVFGQRADHAVDSDDEIVQTIRPITRVDPIYDTPSVIDAPTAVRLRDVPASETVL